MLEQEPLIRGPITQGMLKVHIVSQPRPAYFLCRIIKPFQPERFTAHQGQLQPLVTVFSPASFTNRYLLPWASSSSIEGGRAGNAAMTPVQTCISYEQSCAWWLLQNNLLHSPKVHGNRLCHIQQHLQHPVLGIGLPSEPSEDTTQMTWHQPP